MTRPISEAIPALLQERGALVCSADCSEIELADARLYGRLFVSDDGIGYVLRMQAWLANAEQCLFDLREFGNK